MSQNEQKLDYLSEYCKKFQFLHCFHGVSFLKGDVQKGELWGEVLRVSPKTQPPTPKPQLCLGEMECLKAGVGRGNKMGSNAGVGFLLDKNYSFCCPKTWFLIKEGKKKKKRKKRERTITLQTFIRESPSASPQSRSAAVRLWGDLKNHKTGEFTVSRIFLEIPNQHKDLVYLHPLRCSPSPWIPGMFSRGLRQDDALCPIPLSTPGTQI